MRPNLTTDSPPVDTREQDLGSPDTPFAKLPPGTWRIGEPRSNADGTITVEVTLTPDKPAGGPERIRT